MRLAKKFAAVVAMWVLLVEAIAVAEQPHHPSAPSAPERKIQLDIPSQPLKQALTAVAGKVDVEVWFNTDVSSDLVSKELRGRYTVSEAFQKLLKGTGLQFKYVDGTILVKKPATPEGATHGRLPDGSRKSPTPSKTTPDTAPSVQQDDNDVAVNYVVVTGSRLRIKKAADSAAQRVYDPAAIEQSGAPTLAEFAQLLPENFNSVSPISSLFGNTVGAPQMGNNVFLGTAFNLSGLGPEATLTLLDGDRWVSGGGSGTFLDLSVLPMNAVASVVTLTGDTSAVYGSDAIAGVVNILLRSGADGNEIRVRYGTTSDGGGGQWAFSERLGETWQGGNGMIAYQRTQQSPILSTSRSYIPEVSPAINIVPQQSSSGLLGTLEHEFQEGTSVKAHFLYGARDVTDDSSELVGYLLKVDSPVREYGGTLHIDQSLTPQWTLGLYGSYSTLAQWLTSSPPGVPLQGQPGNSSLVEIGLSANAEPVTLFGHPVRLAFGVGGRKETLTAPTSVYDTNYASLARKVGDAYLETFLPLASGSHTFLKRLELSLVAREDYYETVGPTLNPKAGFVWSPVSDLSFRSTFARSFRPPTLDELAAIPLYYTVNVPDRASPTGLTDTLVNQSQGISRLKPETARTLTGGLDYGRDRSQGWAGSLTWFRTVFDNRIAAPVAVGTTTNIFAQPALAPFISRSINPAQVDAIFASPAFAQDTAGAGPGGVMATLDNQLTNIARTFEEGLEASLRYSNGDPSNRLSAFAIANYLLRDTYRLTPDATSMTLMNNVGQPPNLRARAGVTQPWKGWRTTLNVNYTNGYRNTLATPAQPVHSWTTLDFQLTRKLPVPALTNKSVQLTFNVQNLLNTAPPRVAVPDQPALRPVGFDAANALPFGRTLSLELSVAW